MARSLRVEIQKIEVRTAREFDPAFRRDRQAFRGADAGRRWFFGANQKRLVELKAKNRLAATYPNSQFVEAGGLMAYTEDRVYMFARAAEYVDKILKGAKPADLPVERPNKWELVINLKAAKQIGLTTCTEYAGESGSSDSVNNILHIRSRQL